MQMMCVCLFIFISLHIGTCAHLIFNIEVYKPRVKYLRNTLGSNKSRTKFTHLLWLIFITLCIPSELSFSPSKFRRCMQLFCFFKLRPGYRQLLRIATCCLQLKLSASKILGS